MTDQLMETVKNASVCAGGQIAAENQSSDFSLSIRNFFKEPLAVGSAFPASRWLVRRMLAPVDWRHVKLLIEFGPGTGVLTRFALSRMSADSALLALDTNASFVNHLRRSILDPRMHVVAEPASNAAAVIRDLGFPAADYIVSGLPFSTLDPAEAKRTMRASRLVLRPGGMFCAYQMRRSIEPLLREHIGSVRRGYEWRNIPPCHLYWAKAPEPDRNADPSGRKMLERRDESTGNQGEMP
ncbi:methyltransferase domain-containing protein [Sphingobium sp. MP9-4]|uniref:class I SAM-dependent methyltransferase n=1 Tax=Sphingobium sp. MP9-4 TaxID=1761936 RepID=UPI0010CA83E0|nr:methyltransferase domain-containing protein [Sphingobium sp. MP9-4]